jgi:hypothetical protein
MTFTPQSSRDPCLVCGSPSHSIPQGNGAAIVDCSRCGRYFMNPYVAAECGLPISDPTLIALASHLIRKAQGAKHFGLTKDFFDGLASRTLPSPAEALDNLLLWLCTGEGKRPGQQITASSTNGALLATVGMIDGEDITWLTDSLASQGMLQGESVYTTFMGVVTAQGWQRVEELRRAHVASRFAFFARRFNNPDLDEMFDSCLAPAVMQTGFELRLASQKAGLIDAVIEDEIRRCRFLIADLSDDNAGAYWEAGFAEGLGKPVIYVCAAKGKDGAPRTTHFDTNHRQTVMWDLAEPEETARKLKAIIRNTLLGDANQED